MKMYALCRLLLVGTCILVMLSEMVKSSEFLVKPKNAYVIAGDSVIIQCTVKNAGQDTTQQVWQEFYSDGNQNPFSDDSKILNVKEYPEDFEIVGRYNLFLKEGKSELKHGGKYGCSSTFAQGSPTAYAELIVLESNPRLDVYGADGEHLRNNIAKENDIVIYASNLRYHGRWEPVMNWSDNTGSGTIEHKSENYEDEYSKVVSTFVEFQVKIENNGRKLTCRTSFGELIPDPPNENEAKNIPNYNNIQSFEPLIVHYTPRNTRIEKKHGSGDFKLLENSSTINPGDVIRCVTSSNPEVEFTIWENATDSNNTETLGYGETLTITKTWLGEMTLRCTVINHIGAEKDMKGDDVVMVVVTVQKDTEFNPLVIIVLAVILVSLLVVAFIGYLVFYRRKYKPIHTEVRHLRAHRQESLARMTEMETTMTSLSSAAAPPPIPPFNTQKRERMEPMSMMHKNHTTSVSNEYIDVLPEGGRAAKHSENEKLQPRSPTEILSINGTAIYEPVNTQYEPIMDRRPEGSVRSNHYVQIDTHPND